MQNSSKEQLTLKQAEEEYNKSEKGIKYQLIEGKIISDNNLNVKMEEIKKFSMKMIVSQMTQYGQPAPSEKEMQKIIQRILSDKEEVKRIQDQITRKKLLNFYMDKAPLKVKKVSFESFIKEAYPKT